MIAFGPATASSSPGITSSEILASITTALGVVPTGRIGDWLVASS
jgi:hypothetical protein